MKLLDIPHKGEAPRQLVPNNILRLLSAGEGGGGSKTAEVVYGKRTAHGATH